MTMDGGNRTKRTFTTGADAKLEISNIRGSIVVKSWERDEVQVIATIESDGSCDLIDLTIEGPGNRVVAKAEAVKNVRAWMREVFRSNVPSVYFEIKCPSMTDVSIDSVASKIEIEDIRGTADVNQAAGSIRITDLVGSLALKSVSGDASGRGLSGPVRFKSVSGDLKITDSRVIGLSIQTVSGNVDVDSLAPGEDPIAIKTVSDRTRLVLDPNQGYTATLRTVSGTVDTDFPSLVIENNRTSWKAELNGGGREIRMNSISGDFELVAAESEGKASDTSGNRAQEGDRTSVLKSLEDGDIDVDEALEKLGSETSRGASDIEERIR